MRDANYESIYRENQHSLQDLPAHLRQQINPAEAGLMQQVTITYPMKVNPYYLSLIREVGDGIWNQCIPHPDEITGQHGVLDPLHEEIDSPVPGLVHRYPDRVLVMASNVCPIYCRFCTRKRRVGCQGEFQNQQSLTDTQFEKIIAYLRQHNEVRDVILSGGDPLMLSTSRIEYFLRGLKSVPHVEIIRIGTRIPCAYPTRIDENLCSMLKKYHPLYVNVHFNHPAELTSEAADACAMLADAGIPLGNQSVLLNGVNNDPETMKELVLGLLKMRIKPYYIYIPDNVRGTTHFQTSIRAGLEIIEDLRGWVSGMAVPHLVIDIEGGGGKIPLLPEYIDAVDGNRYTVRNYKGDRFYYYDNENHHD
jgi:lysine 2,3-aminomutase